MRCMPWNLLVVPACVVVLTACGGRSSSSSNNSSPTSPSSSQGLEVKGNYTFELRPLGGCLSPPSILSWPVTSLTWPVTVQVSSYSNGSTVGTILFPAYPVSFTTSQDRWDLRTGPTGTRLSNVYGTSFSGSYTVGMSGDLMAGAPTRATDGRGEILTGQYSLGSSGSFLLYRWDSQYNIVGVWEHCGGATWLLRTR